MFALCVADMTDRVDATVEESAQTEDDMPPVERLDKGYIEQSVVGNCLWQLHNTATVIFADTCSNAEEQVVVYLLAIDHNLYTR